MNRGITWLHLSDLHVGCRGFEGRWAGVMSLMKTDLRRMLGKLDGPLDLVLFTGDLTQRASVQQFNDLDAFLLDLWAEFDKLGCKPMLFAVPGNHDLVRPSKDDLAYQVLAGSWNLQRIQDAFWSTQRRSKTRRLVDKCFENYENWWNQEKGIPKLRGRKGILAGDAACTFWPDRDQGIKLGLVGLNSAFLQLSDDIKEADGQLDIGQQQLNKACDDAVDAWIADHDLCVLLTHHPASWLRNGGETFLEQIRQGPQRFALHLYGHMHEPRSIESSEQGGELLRTSQAASLFSLERFGPERKERLVAGYSFGRLVRKGRDFGYCLLPRVEKVHQDKSREITKDESFQYQTHQLEGTRWFPIKRRNGTGRATIDPLAEGVAEMFPDAIAFQGPPGYMGVHHELKTWLDKYKRSAPRLNIKNIALDMQHTFGFLQDIMQEDWPLGLDWRTLLIDHRSAACQAAFAGHRRIDLQTASNSERQLTEILAKDITRLESRGIRIDARAYGVAPMLHGFLINDSVLISSFSMQTSLAFESTPYFVAFRNPGIDSEHSTTNKLIDMFSSWFDDQWLMGRLLSANTLGAIQS